MAGHYRLLKTVFAKCKLSFDSGFLLSIAEKSHLKRVLSHTSGTADACNGTRALELLKLLHLE